MIQRSRGNAIEWMEDFSFSDPSLSQRQRRPRGRDGGKVGVSAVSRMFGILAVGYLDVRGGMKSETYTWREKERGSGGGVSELCSGRLGNLAS